MLQPLNLETKVVPTASRTVEKEESGSVSPAGLKNMEPVSRWALQRQSAERPGTRGRVNDLIHGLGYSHGAQSDLFVNNLATFVNKPKGSRSCLEVALT